MCGIVGFVGQRTTDLSHELLDRLSTLEYRGYDSAGVVTWDERRGWILVKAVGGLQKLREKLPKNAATAELGIAHTRWATHGVASERNALPIASADGKALIVFNGIVENDLDLRRQLTANGVSFATDNDAETLLLWLLQHDDIESALEEVEGRYAFCLVRAEEPDTIVVACKGSPLIIGRGLRGYFVASDVIAIHADVSHVHYLEDEVIGRIQPRGLQLQSRGVAVSPRFLPTPAVASAHLDPAFETFTEQEIFAQPDTIEITAGLAARSHPLLQEKAQGIEQVILIACGSAYHAACIGERLIQEHAGLFAKAMIASEFRHSHQPIDAKTLVVAISQSGETADTLASLQEAKTMGAATLVIGNTPSSSMARIADIFLPINCGPEIGVASTKAYTGMLVQVTFLALALGSSPAWSDHLLAAEQLPLKIACILAQRSKIERMARTLRERKNFLFIGRDLFLPIAHEGALKLRELTYRHAEGMGAGELKHGTLALIETAYPVIAIAPRTPQGSRMVGSIQEIKARGGQVWGIITEGDRDLEALCHETIAIPETLPAFQPLLATIPLQLFAYEMARTLGRNIDRPRNLAKSVTVE